jgi:hypothetical protein
MTEEIHKIDFNSTSATKTTIPSHSPETTSNSFLPKIIFIVLVIILGTGTGYLINHFVTPNSTSLLKANSDIKTTIPASGIKVGDVIGNPDEKIFKDHSTGVLEQGGIDGEGSHKLLREGGASQTVYLISSVVDLDEFVGAKITVWGETFAAQKAGWLMDVGRIKVEELNVTPPAQ